MKKAGYILAVLLEIAALSGAYIINYFTKKKMGMARWVIYKNQGWEREYPMDVLKMTALAVIVILTILIFLLFLKKKDAGKMVTAMNVMMIVLTVVYVSYTLVSSTETMRAYYFLSLLFGIAAAVQILKTGAAVLLCRKQSYEK